MELPIFDSSLLEGLELKPGDPPAGSIRKGETRAQRTIPITRIYQVLSGKILIIYGSNIRSGSTRRHFSVAVEQGQAAAVAGGLDLEIIGDENSEILVWRDPENKYKTTKRVEVVKMDEPERYIKYSPRSYGEGYVAVIKRDAIKIAITDKKVSITTRARNQKLATEGIKVPGGILSALDISANRVEEIKAIPNSLRYLDVNYNLHIKLPDLSQTRLEVLMCKDCRLKKLPALPQSLKVLVVSRNELTELPNLPPTLEVLRCSNNLGLTELPDLPNTLKHLALKHTKIIKVKVPRELVILDIMGRDVDTTELPNSLRSFKATFGEEMVMPELPEGLERLILADTNNIRLADLPDSLKHLDIAGCRGIENIPEILPPRMTHVDISRTEITRLPSLPNTLIYLNASENNIEILPDLPPNLEDLSVRVNRISELKKLPGSLKRLDVSANRGIKELPELPSGLLELGVYGCSLTQLPPLPSGLLVLVCDDNQIKVLMNLPETLTTFTCDRNPLEFIEPIPQRPTTIQVPADQSKLFSERNYDKYYQSYKDFRTTLVYLVVVGGLRDPHLNAIDLKAKWVAETKKKFR